MYLKIQFLLHKYDGPYSKGQSVISDQGDNQSLFREATRNSLINEVRGRKSRKRNVKTTGT